jgi:hypothetical protein
MTNSENQQLAQPAQRQHLEQKVVGIESTLNITNETMKSQGEFLKLLGSHFNISILDPNVDPAKE